MHNGSLAWAWRCLIFAATLSLTFGQEPPLPLSEAWSKWGAYDAGFLPKGDVLSEGHSDYRIWSARTGRELRVLPKPRRFELSTKLVVGADSFAVWDSDSGVLRAHALSSGSPIWSQSLTPRRRGASPSRPWALTFDPSGNELFIGDLTRHSVRVRDAKTGKLLSRRYQVHGSRGESNTAWQLIFAPDGRTFVVISLDWSLRLWSLKEGRQLWATNPCSSSSASFVAFTPDGKRLITAGAKLPIRTWDVQSGALLRSVKAPAGLVFAALSRDGKQLFACDREGKLSVLSVPSWKVTQTFSVGLEQARLRAGPGGRLLTKTIEGPLRLWQRGARVRSGELWTGVLSSSGEPVFTEGGSHLVLGQVTWNLTTGDAGGNLGPGLDQITLRSATGSRIVRITRTEIQLYKGPTAEPERSIPIREFARAEGIKNSALSADGRWLATFREKSPFDPAGAEGTLELHDLNAPKRSVRNLGISFVRTSALAFDPQGEVLAFARGDELRFIRVRGKGPISKPVKLECGVHEMHYMPGGDRLLLLYDPFRNPRSSRLALWNVGERKVVRNLPIAGAPTDLALAASGDFAIVGTPVGAHVVDLKTFKAVRTIPFTWSDGGPSVGICPTSKRFAVVKDGATRVYLFDTK